MEERLFSSAARKKNDTRNEMERYLDNENLTRLDLPILELWKLVGKNFPTVARMARDILAIPLSGVGVERVFNMARDVCHYRRSRLHANSIQKIMLIKHGDQDNMLDKILDSAEELGKEVLKEDDEDDARTLKEEVAPYQIDEDEEVIAMEACVKEFVNEDPAEEVEEDPVLDID